MVYLVWAMTKTGVIGNNQQLPWKIPAEMQYFRQLTVNKTILMGAKTLLSIGKPLKNRYNIVISHQLEKYAEFVAENCIINNDLTKILQSYQGNQMQDIYVIGGANIYRQALEHADGLFVSIIKHPYQGNVKFPIPNWKIGFQRMKRTEYPEFFADIYQRKDQ